MSERKFTMRFEAMADAVRAYDAELMRKIEAFEAAIRESESIAFDMLSLKGAVGALRFARSELWARVAAASEDDEDDAPAGAESEEG